MIELIKKSLMAGVGAAVVTKDRIEESLSQFVREGKVTADDARKMAEKVAAEGRREFHDACVQLGGKLREVTARADEKTKGQVSELARRLHDLEQRLAASPQPKRAARRRPVASASRAKPATARRSK
jgi:polyhydroxyalkanoate synthesis regulator phasin